jgi:hypothetical protein
MAYEEEAQQLWNAFQTDPVGTYEQLKQALTAEGYIAPEYDPRVDEMYANWQHQSELKAYDAAIAEIVNDPANADIDPNRLHVYVAAAEGDFDNAIELYREDAARALVGAQESLGLSDEQLQELRGQQPPAISGGAPALEGEGNATERLHRAIEEATARSRASRGR